MSIACLLEAAEYLERRDREAEHGYASTLPPDDLNNNYYTHNNSYSNRRKPKSKKSQGNSRHTHNELEKNRRAHLRNCLEKLKDMVPLGNESSRHTTLGLLTKAKMFIKVLEDKEQKHRLQKEQLEREQRYLKRRMEILVDDMNKRHQRRSVSECSSSTSSSSTSESDEVDIIGYNSNQSDSDDHSLSSNSSINSDAVVVTGTRRLSLVEPC